MPHRGSYQDKGAVAKLDRILRCHACLIGKSAMSFIAPVAMR
jgi:hypothetical protein